MSAVEWREECAGAWVRMVLNTPPANVLSTALVSDLRAALSGIGSRPHLKLVTLEGAGSHFSYGASIPEHLPPAVHRMLPEFHGLVGDLLQVGAPTAAIVRGRCLGGGFELALACDFVFAAEDAVLGVPEVTLGVFPPAAAVLLPLKIGAARAARAVVTGEPLSAETWMAAGLITATAPAAQLDAAVIAWYKHHLSGRSAVGLRYAARACRETTRRTALPVLAVLEREYLDALVTTNDGIEGCTAFIEKRAPVWMDR